MFARPQILTRTCTGHSGASSSGFQHDIFVLFFYFLTFLSIFFCVFVLFDSFTLWPLCPRHSIKIAAHSKRVTYFNFAYSVNECN